jgi:hypothetical protein
MKKRGNSVGYKVKIQKGQRPTNRAFKVVMPTAIAEAIKMEKGEDFEWLIEDKNTLVLTRCNKLALRRTNDEPDSSQ